MTALEQRDLANTLDDAKTTLGSWDGCMSKAYCKWPVIIAIIVGGLIIASIVFCVVRCCCCGLECCCGCFRCCNSCCPSPRKRKDKTYVQTPQQPPAYLPQQGPQPWQAQQPQPHDLGMMSGALPPQPAEAQFARFSSQKSAPTTTTPVKNGDALPAMPTWSDAREHKEEDKTYLPRAESPPGAESALDKELGQEGIPLKDQTPRRRPTLPDLDAGQKDSTAPPGRGPAGMPSNAPSRMQTPSNAPSRMQTPASAYGAGREAGPGRGGPPGAAGYGLQRGPNTRTPPNHNPYFAGAAPPRRPSEWQPGPQQSPYGYQQPYGQQNNNGHDVSPVSPLPPEVPAQNNHHYGYQPPSANAPPQPAYASRQSPPHQAPHGPPPPRLNQPPMPRNQTPAAGYGPPRGQPTRTPPQQSPYGPPLPQSRTPPAQAPYGYAPPQPYGQQQLSSRSPPPQQGYYGSGPQQPMPPAHPPQQQASYGPQQGYSQPRAAAGAPAPSYTAFNPTASKALNSTVGRAELGGPDTGRAEMGSAQSAPRFELGGGDGSVGGRGEGGEWQGRPVGGWS